MLTYGDRRIINDERISVERPRLRDWNLLIRDVQYSDQGNFVCQINTLPIKTNSVLLNVLGKTVCNTAPHDPVELTVCKLSSEVMTTSLNFFRKKSFDILKGGFNYIV